MPSWPAAPHDHQALSIERRLWEGDDDSCVRILTLDEVLDLVERPEQHEGPEGHDGQVQPQPPPLALLHLPRQAVAEERVEHERGERDDPGQHGRHVLGRGRQRALTDVCRHSTRQWRMRQDTAALKGQPGAKPQ